jgi:hypothetical protein
MKDRLKIFYVGKGRGHGHEGVMTIATEVQKDGKTLHVGIAFCSPEDPFIRKLGRQKAIGRMNSKAYEVCEFTGHSSNDIVPLFNSKNYFHSFGDNVEKPQIWKERYLVSNSSTGLSYVYIA